MIPAVKTNDVLLLTLFEKKRAPNHYLNAQDFFTISIQRVTAQLRTFGFMFGSCHIRRIEIVVELGIGVFF